MLSIFQRFVLPGLVFQGIVIGGGYATGRELVEFFMKNGPLDGLKGMLVAALIWSAVMSISFELCRSLGRFDYKSFFRALIGPYWIVYEILYVAILILSLAVIGAATGEIIHDMFGVGVTAGTAVLLVAIAVLVFLGSRAIERFMGLWSLALYAAYASLVVVAFRRFGFNISTELSVVDANQGGSWFIDGVRYAGYNISVVPAVFFCLRHMRRRSEAVAAGFLAGFIAIFPGMLLYLALLADYPSITVASVPSSQLLDLLGVPLLTIVFECVLIGTFVQTGLGLIHTVNERIAATMAEHGKRLTRILRPLIAAVLLLTALLLASEVGLVNLIAHGYGMITYGFIAVFVIPVLTIGLMKVVRNSGARR